MRVRSAVVGVLLACPVSSIACARTQPFEPSGAPTSAPAPSTKVASSGDGRASAGPSSASAPDGAPPGSAASREAGREHACEPIVRCGFWSDCVWLERLDASRYRAIGGQERGGVFVRRHACRSTSGGERCAVHCTGADGGAPCVDGLHPEKEDCSESAPPSPNATRCLIGAGVCGSLM